MADTISPILVTGAAGFIGAALSIRLIKEGARVIGIDNLNSYYDPTLKKSRLSEIDKTLKSYEGSWKFYEASLEDDLALKLIFSESRPKVVVNLAAQAGVRYSLENPAAYVQSNLVGFSNILEACRNYEINHLLYASSSSVYGGNRNLPFQEKNSVDHPVSFYAATKKANELMAHSYSHLFGIPSTGLRFFTVYGPFGRPDMAPMIFAKAMLSGKPIDVYNYGNMKRDFTYIDDIVEGVFHCCNKPSTPNKNFNHLLPDPSSSFAPHRVFNIGNNTSVKLLQFIELLEKHLGVKAKKNFKNIQPGDVEQTFADTNELEKWINFSPSTSIEKGVKNFADWYLDYHKI